MNKPVIIGAGIAGLAAANHLADKNIQSILIEADTIGKIKVCGEFFSPEAIKYLNKWDIQHILIEKANFNIKNNMYSFNLPLPCASVTRSDCEITLSNRARNLGSEIFENTKVINIIPAKNNHDNHIIQISNGQIIETNKLIIATGRLPTLNTQKKIEPEYIGIKAHFKNIDLPSQLYMHLNKDTYFGITYINNDTVNICCLAKKSLVDKFKTIQDFMDYNINYFHYLKPIYKNALQLNQWLTCGIAQFGKKEIPNWPNTYFIGDAAATIHPASGNGLSMGLTSGIMATEHLINSTTNFKKLWQYRYNTRLNYAKIMHKTFINPPLANLIFKISKIFPKINDFFYKKTRDKF